MLIMTTEDSIESLVSSSEKQLTRDLAFRRLRINAKESIAPLLRT